MLSSLQSDKSPIRKLGLDILAADMRFYSPEALQYSAEPHIRSLATCELTRCNFLCTGSMSMSFADHAYAA